jgi:hypothetical protein
MTDNAVIERARMDFFQGSGGSSTDESVEYHRHAPEAGTVNSTGNRRKFPASKAAKYFHTIR